MFSCLEYAARAIKIPLRNYMYILKSVGVSKESKAEYEYTQETKYEFKCGSVEHNYFQRKDFFSE